MNACAFCGSLEPLLSPEDIWPHWLSKTFRRELPIKRFHHHTLSPDGTHDVEPSQRIKFQARVVCESCNTGWMSGLEDHTKDILLPLVMNPNDGKLLTLEDRFALASWFTLKAIVIDQNRVVRHNAKPFFSPQARARFMRSLEPPERVSVWIARLTDVPERGGLVLPVYGTFNGQFRHLTAYSVTFSALRFAIQLLVHKPFRRLRHDAIDKLPIVIYPTHGTWGDYVLRVWSDQGDLTWPPGWQLTASELGDGDFQFFAHRFFGFPPSGARSLFRA